MAGIPVQSTIIQRRGFQYNIQWGFLIYRVFNTIHTIHHHTTATSSSDDSLVCVCVEYIYTHTHTERETEEF